MPMVNEAARILEKVLASRPIDSTVIFINFSAADFGAGRCSADSRAEGGARQARAISRGDGGCANLKPAALIEMLAAEGGSFAAMGAAARAA